MQLKRQNAHPTLINYQIVISPFFTKKLLILRFLAGADVLFYNFIIENVAKPAKKNKKGGDWVMFCVNVSICSNDAATLSQLQRLIAQQLIWDDAETLIYSDKASCLKEISRVIPDIAIIDTDLADGSGLDLAQELTARTLRCQILFVSDDISKALDVYKVDHAAFVMKSQLSEKMPFFLQKCYEKVQKEKVSLCVMKSRSEQRIFPQKDILFVESNHRILEITTFSRKETVYGTLSEIQEQLNPYYFAQCHKSYIVNLEHLIGISAEEVEFCTGAKVPISRLYRKSFQEQYDRFMARKKAFTGT